MEKPDLNRMWETFIKIRTEDSTLRFFSLLYNDIRTKIYPMISRLKDNDLINWYCLLIHDRGSGVPTSADDMNAYFHIRFALKKDANPDKFVASLPEYCNMTRRIEGGHQFITGIDKSIIKNEDITEAWRIIGEQSEWFLEMLNIHKENSTVPPQQVAQFLHFFANMTQLQIG